MPDSVQLVRMGTAFDPILAEASYQLGLAVLKTQLKTHTKYVLMGCSSRAHARIIQESLAFVQGSDLAITIQRFGLEVDPELFRETYQEWLDYQRRHHLPPISASLSATTLGG